MKLPRSITTSYPVLFLVAIGLVFAFYASPFSFFKLADGATAFSYEGGELVSAHALLAQISGSGGGGGTSGSGGNTSGGLAVNNPLRYTDLQSFLYALLDLVLLIGYIVAVFFIIFSGFKFVMAQGNPGEISKARNMLMWTVIGTAVLIGAKVIATVIQATVEAL